ncbi:MAG: nucleotidyl transferase AbiEii/AbiGii toxin family protein [Chlamydiae bacterium]|nr:nucleotidyl transferase AbiEii/AbiGii toxin family protein [Chlamydiota bacterium]
MRRHVQSNEIIKIKLEIDIDPPPEFSTEMKYLTRPIPFPVRTYVPSDLFAGKMHAALCRPYQVRVKGRDWYDLIWYVSRRTPLHLQHLESRMRQSHHYTSQEPLTRDVFLDLLQEKILKLDILAAKEDIRRFIRHPRELDGWCTEFFLSLLPQILYQEK